MSKRSQKQRLLALLKARKDEGVQLWELIAPQPNGLGIAQYNARIKELRTMGCNIVSTDDGRFVLKTSPETPKIVPKQAEPAPTYLITNIDLEVNDRLKNLTTQKESIELRMETVEGKQLERLQSELKFIETQMNILRRALPSEESRNVMAALL